MNLDKPKLKDAQKIQQQIGGQATMPLALVREIELGLLKVLAGGSRIPRWSQTRPTSRSRA